MQIDKLEEELSLKPGIAGARSVVQRHAEKFQKAWSKATPAQQKLLTRMVFESLVVTPDGINVYYWTSEEQAATAAPKGKKAPESSPGAVYNLNDFRKATSAFPSSVASGHFAVAGASADQVGGGGGN